MIRRILKMDKKEIEFLINYLSENKKINYLSENKKIIDNTNNVLTHISNLQTVKNNLTAICKGTVTSITFDVHTIDVSNHIKINTGFKDITEENRKFLSKYLSKSSKAVELPDIMNISQNHQTNSIHDTIAGGKNLRIQGKTSKLDIDLLTEKLTVIMRGKKQDYITTITLENFVDIKRFFIPNMAKLLDLIFYHVNIDGSSSSTLTVIEYLKYCGRKVTIDTIKEAKKEIKIYLDSLFKMYLQGKSGKYTITRIQPFSKVVLRRGGIIEVNMDSDLEEALDSNFLQMHKEVGKLSGIAYFIASYIYRFVKFKKAWKFSLTNETLYEYSGLPRYDELKNGQNLSKLIIDPYHKAILEIQGTLKEKIVMWQNPFEESNWEEFKKAKVDIELPDFKSYVNELILSQTKAIKKVVKRKKNKDNNNDK
jgi:hypothetical protein